MKTILVTGGVGFIGTNLCLRLLREGNQVIAIDNLYTSLKSNLELLQAFPNFTFIDYNIIDSFYSLALEDYAMDEVYHLACPASPPQYQKDPIFTLRTSIWGTYNVLELAKQVGAKMLFTSTSEVYGDPHIHPQVESYWGNVNPIGIRSNYDEGKRCAETLIMDYHRQFKLPLKIVRIFNTYGTYMDPEDGRVVSNFIMQALRNENITVYGEGKQTRSFQYVDDLLEGLIKMMQTEPEFTGPVNLGNPNEFTILDLAQKVLHSIPNSTSQLIYKPLPSDDPKQRKPDISLATTKLNWEPQIQIDEGLAKTVEYFQQTV